MVLMRDRLGGRVTRDKRAGTRARGATRKRQKPDTVERRASYQGWTRGFQAPCPASLGETGTQGDAMTGNIARTRDRTRGGCKLFAEPLHRADQVSPGPEDRRGMGAKRSPRNNISCG